MRIGRATSSQVNKNSSSGLLPVTELTHTLAWGKWPCTACEPGWNLAPISSHILPVLYFLCEKKVITDKMLKLNWIAGFKLKSATLNPFPPQCCFDWGMFVWHCPSAMTLIQINFHTGSCGGSFFFFFWLLSRLYKTKVTLWYASMENDIFCDWLNCLSLIPPDRQHSFFLAMDTTELNKCLKETSKAFKSSFPRHYTSWLSIPW